MSLDRRVGGSAAQTWWRRVETNPRRHNTPAAPRNCSFNHYWRNHKQDSCSLLCAPGGCIPELTLGTKVSLLWLEIHVLLTPSPRNFASSVTCVATRHSCITRYHQSEALWKCENTSISQRFSVISLKKPLTCPDGTNLSTKMSKSTKFTLAPRNLKDLWHVLPRHDRLQEHHKPEQGHDTCLNHPPYLNPVQYDRAQ